MITRIRVAIVDDHALMRAGFRAILAQQSDIDIVGEGASGEEALALVRTIKPDVLLLDVSMPGVSGVEVAQRLQRAKSATRIVVVTMHAEGPLPKILLESGAVAYLTKGCAAEELVGAVRRAARGERYIDHAIAQRLAFATADSVSNPLDKLSAREIEVALMIGRGERSSEVAKRLNISEKTVHTHKMRLLEKLGLNSEPALTMMLVRYGMMSG
jgi:DNA-binding NarL/FixJ family response regulator